MEENMVVIREPRTCCFDFVLLKDVGRNLKHETEYMIKSNESLAENKIKIWDWTVTVQI